MRAFFIVKGPLIWLDEHGEPDGYFDVHSYIAMCREHYEKIGPAPPTSIPCSADLAGARTAPRRRTTWRLQPPTPGMKTSCSGALPHLRLRVLRPPGFVLPVSLHGRGTAARQPPPRHAVVGAGPGLGGVRGPGLWSDRNGIRKPLLIAAVILFSLCSALSGLVGASACLLFRGDGLAGADPAALAIPDGGGLLAAPARPQHGPAAGSAAGLLGAVIGPPVLIGLAEASAGGMPSSSRCCPGC